MKEDPNLIFTLRAISDYARNVFGDAHNKRYYVPPPPLEVIAATSRESTPATNIGDEEEYANGQDELVDKTRNVEGKGDDSEDFSHQLRFTFDRKPRNIKRGFIFGSNPKTCDIILGNSNDGISGSHFRITFDDQARLVLIDSSTHGTAVSYGGQAREDKRKNPPDRTRKKLRDKSNDFPWILFPEIKNKRVIIGEDIPSFPNAPVIEFLVEVTDPQSESCKEQYTDLRDAYLAEMRTAIPFDLNIDSPKTTAGQTESHSPKQHPKQRPIWIDREEIGTGAFAIVYRAVNVSTGKWYAAKTFMRNKYRKEWDREVAILRKVSHNHIIKFEDHDVEHKWPRLIMEYLPLGNLADQNGISRITEWEAITLLCQGLDALDYLHSRNIVHRDLKPENILVQCRDPLNFNIKIADFGLAKDKSFLKTRCGTYIYTAPEIWQNRPYDAKVDIWSLGLIVYKFPYRRLPKVEDEFDPGRWYPELAREIDDWESDDLIDFLRSDMLKMDPHERLSASKCLEESAKLRKANILAQNLETDLGTPTEKMSSSAIIEAFRAAGYGGQRIAAEEAETQINLPTLSLLKSDWQPGGDGGDPEEAGTSFDFPTLSTLKSVWQPGEYLETLTQIWDPPGDAVCRSKEDEGSQQEVEIGAGNGSDERHSKRQRIEWPGVLPSSSQSKHTTPEIISLTALSDRGPSSVNAGLHRNSKDGPNLTKTSSHITEWEGSYLRPFRPSELQTGHSVRARLAHPRHCEDDQFALPLKATDKDRPSGPFPEAAAGSTTQLQDIQEFWDPSRVPHSQTEREQPTQSSIDHLPGGGGRQKSGPSFCRRSQLSKRKQMARSHVVASNLREEPPGYITMNVEGRAVQMRKSDCWLNATQILLLAGKNVNDLRPIYDTLRRYARWQLRQDTIEGILHNQFWVCYHVGKRLSEVLDVSNALGPLIEYGRKAAAPLNEKDDKLDLISRYFEKIRLINARKGTLSIRLRDLWVNADHICREAEIDWPSFKRRKEYKADHYDYVMAGPRASWGHYTNPSNALRLCVMLHLEQLELLLRATLKEHGY